jgi:Domain of unknown function (DUF6883)
MAQLPGGDRAVIPPEKLRDYVLCPDHLTGQHKARVFQSALGIRRDDWEYLRDQIVAGLKTASVGEVRSSFHGFLYAVPMLVEGLNGETHEVVTAWIIEEGDATPRLTTAYVNVP